MMSTFLDQLQLSNEDDLLPSGYHRSEYHDYGMTDDDITLWGFDQPDAPSPKAVAWAVVELLDVMVAARSFPLEGR